MTASRAAYWREYDRKHREKRKAIHAAWRARNKEKIAADKRAARAAGKVAPRKVAAVRVVKPMVVKPDETKAEAFLTLREKFAAFRAKRAEARE